MSSVTNKMKQTLPQIGWLLGFWLLGELISYLLGLSVPGSVIGMVLLTLALEFKLIKLSSVESVSDFLIRNMAFFFVPPGVGLMVNMELIANNWLSISVTIVLTSILILLVTGFVSQLGRKKNINKSES